MSKVVPLSDSPGDASPQVMIQLASQSPSQFNGERLSEPGQTSSEQRLNGTNHPTPTLEHASVVAKQDGPARNGPPASSSIDASKELYHLSEANSALLSTQVASVKVLRYEEDSEEDKRLPWILRKSALNGGYKYLVVLAGFLLLLAFSSTLSMSLLLSSFQNHFGVNKSQVSAFICAELGLFCTYTTLMGRLADRMGIWNLCAAGFASTVIGLMVPSALDSFGAIVVVYAIFVGFGAAVLQLMGILVVQDWFEPSGTIGMALGFTLAAVGIGNVAFTYFIQYFLDYYSWRVALFYTGILVGGIGILTLVIVRERVLHGASIRKLIGQFTELKAEAPPIFAVKLLSHHRFALFIISAVSGCFMFYAPFVHMIPSAEAEGLSTNDASFLLVINGIVNIPMRAVFGVLADKLGGIAVCFISHIMLMGTFVIWYFSHTLEVFRFLSVWNGIAGAAFIVGCSHAPKQLSLPKDIPSATSMTFGFSFILGATFAGLIMGWVYDAYGSYSRILIGYACTEAIPILSLAYILFYKPELNLPKETSKENEAAASASNGKRMEGGIELAPLSASSPHSPSSSSSALASPVGSSTETNQAAVAALMQRANLSNGGAKKQPRASTAAQVDKDDAKECAPTAEATPAAAGHSSDEAAPAAGGSIFVLQQTFVDSVKAIVALDKVTTKGVSLADATSAVGLDLGSDV